MALRAGVWRCGDSWRIPFGEVVLVKEQGLGEEKDDEGCGHPAGCDG